MSAKALALATSSVATFSRATDPAGSIGSMADIAVIFLPLYMPFKI
jgi:hypothetical protein